MFYSFSSGGAPICCAAAATAPADGAGAAEATPEPAEATDDAEVAPIAGRFGTPDRLSFITPTAA